MITEKNGNCYFDIPGPCPKCKFPEMAFLWNQHRGAGVDMLYEEYIEIAHQCPKCRYKINASQEILNRVNSYPKDRQVKPKHKFEQTVRGKMMKLE